MKKRNFNFSTKINKLKRRLKYFAEIVSKKEKQMREANARKLNCSIDDIDKFYAEAKDPSKQAMVFKGEIITPEDRKELYNINTWTNKIKTDGQEKASQDFIEFVQREQPLLKEYEEVFKNGVTPDGKGKLLEVITTPDNYNWEVWKVDSYKASRYLGGAFGDSVTKKILVTIILNNMKTNKYPTDNMKLDGVFLIVKIIFGKIIMKMKAVNLSS